MKVSSALRTLTPLSILVATVGLAAPASAQQFGNEWLEFVNDPGSIDTDGTLISNASNEVDFESGDLDQDGWTDLVVVRKQPFSTTGARTNILFMNVSGVLSDLSAMASASDVPGDQGFLTPTNDRDVEIVDVDGDGWLDVVTSTARAENQPKHVSHPRVYRGLGAASGIWNGLGYEESRFPELVNFISGQPQVPVFCDVSSGDVTGNGFPDLYFAHYDFSNNGFNQSALEDLDDRLLINDGAGFFTDQSQQRMKAQMLTSSFGLGSEIVDINGDGAADILKDTALENPYYISISYNDPNDLGQFKVFDPFHNLSPYHFDTADLNNDGRIDIAMGDDDDDRHRYNLGNDALGRAIWGPSMTFDFISGGDDGFSGQVLIVDLDGDGWDDALIADVDTDEPGYNRRLNVYHNPGGTPGTQIQLREERQNSGNGWVGAVGLYANFLKGTFDVASFDVDNDGDLELIVGRSQGTQIYQNQAINDVPCTAPVNYGAADTSSIGNVASIGSSGGDPSVDNPNFTITLAGGNPNQGSILVESLSQDSVTTPWGTLLVGTFIRHPSFTSATGTDSYVVPMMPALAGTTVYYQWVVRDPGTGAIAHHSDGLAVTFCNN